MTFWYDVRPKERTVCFDVSQSTDRSPVVLFGCHGMKVNVYKYFKVLFFREINISNTVLLPSKCFIRFRICAWTVMPNAEKFLWVNAIHRNSHNVGNGSIWTRRWWKNGIKSLASLNIKSLNSQSFTGFFVLFYSYAVLLCYGLNEK